MRRFFAAFLLTLTFSIAQTTHTVQPGETLYQIAQQYSTTVEALQALNNLANPNQLSVGQVLEVSAQPASAAQRLTNLPAPFTLVRLPSKVIQGQAFRVRVEAAGNPVEVSFIGANYKVEGRDLLLAIDPLQKPGGYTLELRSGSSSYKTTLEVAEANRGRQALQLDQKTLNLLQPKKEKAELNRLLSICQADQGPQTWAAPWKKPISSNRITTNYGMRRSYNGGPYRTYHEGIDYAAPQGTKVFAPAPGVVALAEPLFVRGNGIVIQHGLGVCSGYWHLSKILVKPGQRVNTGDLIGLVGTTGLSTGPHLHFEIRVQGIPTDPDPWYLRAP